ncbi:hypothetical protein BZG02_05195 [Labilibaculum filiforme]|uniref:Uncharacterized protein n=1 Tax=Labilibaculum filiforme TaxID=1940526 RepID=A0A2N3I1M4_9BACT|nr:hypothetical protein [Labilibaculum filiforme]PKQ64219.1 hypothetical protein BZG02_05195 [Labilibaculum filiforme]
MNNLFTIFTFALHLFAIIDALSHIKERNGGFRMVLAVLPPLIGPIIYFLTKRSKTVKRGFMQNKKRYS